MHDLSPPPVAALAAGDDQIQPFILESSGIRGRLLRLGPVADGILGRHAYPPPIAGLLAELLALAGTLSSLLKFEGFFTLQTSGDGPVTTMVADVTSDGVLRGYAGFDAARLAAVEPITAPVPQLLGRGHFAFTVDQGEDSERYQGIVALSGESLADCLQHYFLQSEQIQTGILLAAAQQAGAWRAAALVLQRLPEEALLAAADDADSWQRAMVLQASCTEAELLDPGLSAPDLLYRLFHQEGVRIFEPRPLVDGCRCSRDRLKVVLGSLPRDEVMAMRQDGQIVMTCQFCNQTYEFDAADLASIWAGPEDR